MTGKGAYCQCHALTKRGDQCRGIGTRNAAKGPYADPIWLCSYHFHRKDAQ